MAPQKPSNSDRSIGERAYRYEVLEHSLTAVVQPEQKPKRTKTQQEKRVWVYKCVRLAALTLCLSGQGLDDCLTSPTIPDMRDRLKLSMEEFARGSIAQSLGVMAGSVIGGLVSDRFSRFVDLIVACALGVMGTCVILRPWSPSLAFLCINNFIDGLANGAIISGTSAIHLGLWGSKAMPMYIKNLGWTVTCPVAPLLAKDFLSDVNHTFDYSPINASSRDSYVLNKTLEWWEFADGSMIQIPYAVCGLLIYSMVPVFAFFQWKKPPPGYKTMHQSKQSWKEVFSPGSCANGATCFSVSILISMTTYYFLLVAANSAVWDLTFSYVVDPRTAIHFTKDQASYLQTAQTSVYLVCRVLTIFVSPLIPIQVLLGGTVFTSLILMGCLTFVGLHNVTYFWVFLLAVSFTVSPAWAAGTLWPEHYIHVYATMIGFANLGSGFSQMLFSWTNGRIFDSDHPNNMFYLGFGFYCLLGIHFILSQINASCHVRKNGHKSYLNEISVDSDSEQLLCHPDNLNVDYETTELDIVNGTLKQGENHEDASL